MKFLFLTLIYPFLMISHSYANSSQPLIDIVWQLDQVKGVEEYTDISGTSEHEGMHQTMRISSAGTYEAELGCSNRLGASYSNLTRKTIRLHLGFSTLVHCAKVVNGVPEEDEEKTELFMRYMGALGKLSDIRPDGSGGWTEPKDVSYSVHFDDMRKRSVLVLGNEHDPVQIIFVRATKD